MTYLDGFVTPVPRANRAAYEAHVAQAAAIFADLGATRLVECWGDDVLLGQHTDFARAVALTDDEDVLFSWIEYPDRATRDAAGAAMIRSWAGEGTTSSSAATERTSSSAAAGRMCLS